jgi:hypothetical protein
MRKTHYDLLHKFAEKQDSRQPDYSEKNVECMEQDPDAYLASVLNRLVESLKPGGWVEMTLKSAKYKPDIKKMRKLLDQEPEKHQVANHQ